MAKKQLYIQWDGQPYRQQNEVAPKSFRLLNNNLSVFRREYWWFRTLVYATDAYDLFKHWSLCFTNFSEHTTEPITSWDSRNI